jgi:hypothetical protein
LVYSLLKHTFFIYIIILLVAWFGFGAGPGVRELFAGGWEPNKTCTCFLLLLSSTSTTFFVIVQLMPYRLSAKKGFCWFDGDISMLCGMKRN